MTNRTLRLATLLIVAPALHAQKTATAPRIQPSRFLPANYETIAFIDLAQIREVELWDGLRTSAAGALFGMFETEHGFGMESLDELYLAPDAANERGMRPKSIRVMIGNQNVTFPLSLDQDSAETVTAGGFNGFLHNGDIIVSPAKGALVQGDRSMLEPLLKKKLHSGVPSPNLLMATSYPGNLAYVVISPTPAESRLNPLFKELLPVEGDHDWFSKDDPFQSMTIRLAIDRDTDHVSAHVEGRFAHGEANADAFETHLANWFGAAQKTQQALPLRSLMKKIEFHRDGPLVGARVDLGPPRQAAAHLATILPMMMMGRGAPEVKRMGGAQPAKKK